MKPFHIILGLALVVFVVAEMFLALGFGYYSSQPVQTLSILHPKHNTHIPVTVVVVKDCASVIGYVVVMQDGKNILLDGQDVRNNETLASEVVKVIKTYGSYAVQDNSHCV